MNNIAKIVCFGLLISSFGCGMGEWNVTLYEQKIENSSKVIYEFDAWGGRDSHRFGIVLMDSTEQFVVNSARKLPISYFTNIPNKTAIKGIKLKKASNNDNISLEAIDSEEIKISNIDIHIEYYEKYSGYSDAGCILNEYKFDSFMETKDSLFFNGIEKEFGTNLKNRKSVGFKKGNIKLISDPNGKVFRVEIKELFKDNANKHRYKKGTAEIIERTANSPVVCIRTYYLTPNKETKVSEFSDYGIFKPVN